LAKEIAAGNKYQKVFTGWDVSGSWEDPESQILFVGGFSGGVGKSRGFVLKENVKIIEAIMTPRLFGGLAPFKDLSTWKNWLIFFKVIDGLKLTAAEFRRFQKFTAREKRTAYRFREIFLICGRRAGKSWAAAVVACALALFREWNLGVEKGHILIIAKDRQQAGVVFGYIREILQIPAFRGMIRKELAESLELRNGVVISIHTCNFRALRGYKILALIADEVAFWLTEGSNPAGEIFRAVRPSLGETPGSLLLALSSPYSKAGPLWNAYADYFGVDDPHTLIWKGTTREMNPCYSQAYIDGEMAKDQSSAMAEYYADFRDDINQYIDPEIIDECIVAGRHELPPNSNFRYFAFCDPAGGGGKDAFTLAIFHKEKEEIVQDVIRARWPRFNPSEVIGEYSGILKSYGIQKISGDRYAGNFPVEQFEKNGIRFEHSELNKSDIYIEALSYLNTGRVELLDHKKMILQFKGLERRTGRSKDLIDHGPGAHDDLANSAAGGITLAAQEKAGGYFAVAEKSMLG
jgi:hypothetical protein